MGRNPTNNKKKRKSKINPREFIIDLDNVDQIGKTTVMIKNIPNRYNKSMLLRTINKKHAGKFDFFYLPIDFKVNPNSKPFKLTFIRINAMWVMLSLILPARATSNLFTWSLIIRNGRSSTVTR